MDRRELEFREMDRQKDVDRERLIRDRHSQQHLVGSQHQHQLQRQQMPSPDLEIAQERERREKVQCSNAEQAVSKHFEESLRRAKKQMRSVWTLNALPPQHPSLHLPPHMNISSSHIVQPQLSTHTSSINNLSSLSTMPAIISQTSQSSATHNAQNQFVQTQQHSIQSISPNSQSTNVMNVADEQRRKVIECERLMVHRERERDRREKDRELDRIRQQQDQHRAYYAVASGLQPRGSIQQKVVDKSPPLAQLKSDTGGMFPVYNYTSFGQGYQKDLKSKSDMVLPTPPPLMPDIKSQTAGSVIVKHDTYKPASVKIIQTKSSSVPLQQQQQQQSSFTTVSSSPVVPHVMYEYRTTSLNKSNERYKTNVLPQVQQESSTIQYIPQPAVHSQQSLLQQSVSITQQQQKSIHYSIGTPTVSQQSKPKVSSPAPTHIYGQPGGASIPTGISVGRTQQDSSINTTVEKPNSSSFQSHNIYGLSSATVSPTIPPPAHSSRSVFDSRLFSSPVIKQTRSVPLYSNSSKTAPVVSIASSHNSDIIMKTMPSPQNIRSATSTVYQTQPLDLGVSDRNRDDSCSPKRKALTASILYPNNNIDAKKQRIEQTSTNSLILSVSPLDSLTTVSSDLINNSSAMDSLTLDNMQLESVSSSPIKTTVTSSSSKISSVLSIEQAAIVQPIASISPTTNSLLSVQINRANSIDGDIRPSSTNSSLSPAESTFANMQSAPGTPIKFSDPEKSTSPATKRSSSITIPPPRHLKKAWLQRHTGEDYEDTTGVVGSGSCVKLPLTLDPVPGNSASIEISENEEQHQETVHESTSFHSVNIAYTNIESANKENRRKNLHQDHSGLNSDTDQKDESSSSDQETVQKIPSKRKSTKAKRRKAGIRKFDEKKKKIDISESDKDNSETDKGSLSDKDSDSTTSGGTSISKKILLTTNGSPVLSTVVNLKERGGGGGEPRRRGRRPKITKDEPIKKKFKDDIQKLKDHPFRKLSNSQLKKSGESFLQDGPCFEVAPKLPKCRECRWTPNQRSKNTPNIFCRFYAFRRLRYTKSGILAIAGFSDPHKDPTSDDLKLWMPDPDNPPKNLDLQMSRFLLAQVADQFCDLLQQEKEAMAEHISEDRTVAWKRVVQGVREMCDVCETTLFNYHWACGKCGFVVCIDCYKDRKQKAAKIWGEVGKDRDDFSWLLCTNRAPHEQDRLMLTQIIAGESLQILGRRIHEDRALWQIPQLCGCPLSKDQPPKTTNGVCKELIRNMIKGYNEIKVEIQKQTTDDDDGGQVFNGSNREEKDDEKEDNKSALSWLADVALENANTKNGNNHNQNIINQTEEVKNECDSSSDSSDDGQHSTLRELLIRSSGKTNNNGNISTNLPTQTRQFKVPKKSKLEALEVLLKSVQMKKNGDEEEDDIAKSMQLKYYVGNDKKRRKYLPIRIMTLTESKILYPDVPHTWLCDGKLLRLLDASHSGNYKIFQEQWKRGQPVVVSDVSKCLNMDLWRPESFTRDFGEDKNDLINCMNGNLVPNQPMKKFWDGFEYVNKRLKDEKGNPMLLKLKDWPPGEDFAEILPTRFNDLMKALPLGDYTQRSGRLNLASRLPDCFVRPDLGPKMYNAYGSALHPTKGTTNLHLDISDAVNVMVYVGIAKDGLDDEHIKEAFRSIDEAGCDILTRRRVRERCELPGALWHIYSARDSDKIRDLLNKVAIERGARLEPNHDPIHDQSWYLDGTLRERLYKEYGVEGYPIAQCLGDAVFIPAGAPHQVRNLHNCIKVAEDFVSPENVSHCFHLTQEFRELSETHSNHEDKLQIKNIIYHAVKDALACLSNLLGQGIMESQGVNINENNTNEETTSLNSETNENTVTIDANVVKTDNSCTSNEIDLAAAAAGTTTEIEIKKEENV